MVSKVDAIQHAGSHKKDSPGTFLDCSNEQVYGKFNVLWVTGAIRLQETPGDVAKAPFQMSKKDFDAWPDPVSKKNARNYPADLLPEDEWF